MTTNPQQKRIYGLFERQREKECEVGLGDIVMRISSVKPVLCPFLTPCQIITPLVEIAIWLPNPNPTPNPNPSPTPNPKPTNTRGVIIWQGSELGTTPVPWLGVNLHHLFSNGVAFNTQSRRSLTSDAISRSYRRRLNCDNERDIASLVSDLRLCVKMPLHLKTGDGD